MHALRSLLIAPFLISGIQGFSQLKVKPAPKTPVIGIQPVKIKNGIQFKSKVFKVIEAYLLFDDASSVPPNNNIAVNQRLNLIFRIKTGWAEREGMVFPGGSQIITSADGKLVLNSGDVFKNYDSTGVSSRDAEYITLKAIINSMDTKSSSVTVSFRVWDKKGVGEITGTYKLYIK